jgi:hypothetical protein
MINPLQIMFDISLFLAEFGEGFFDLINVSLVDVFFIQIGTLEGNVDLGYLIFEVFAGAEWDDISDVITEISNATPFLAIFLNVYVLSGLFVLRFIKLYIPVLGA